MTLFFRIGAILALATTVIKVITLLGIVLPFGLGIVAEYSFVFYALAVGIMAASVPFLRHPIPVLLIMGMVGVILFQAGF